MTEEVLIDGLTEEQAAKAEQILKLRVLTLKRRLFEQIKEPPIEAVRDEAIEQAKQDGIAIVIRPDEIYGQVLWLVCRNETGLYRWRLGAVRSVEPDFAWLYDLPQLFLP